MNDWFEAEQRVERAQQLSESMRWEEALAEIDVALTINPHHANWHAHRGTILDELERWDEAADAFENALQLEPGDRDIATALGACLRRLGRLAQALQVFDELARLHPDFEPAYCHRIGIYEELGHHERAEEMFYLAQDLDEACPHCFFHMGASLAARGETARALFCWQRVLDLEPEYIGVNRRIAQAYRVRGERKTAKEYYLRELRDDPGNTDLLFELAELLLESKQVAAAAAKLAFIVELDPMHIDARFALGKIWLLRGQPKQALTCFEGMESITDADPTLFDFELVYGEALFLLGRLVEARRKLESSIERDPADHRALMLLGDCLLAMRKPSDAADAFRRVLATDPRNHFAQYQLGGCLCVLEQYESGLRHFQEAIREKPDFGPAMLAAVRANLRLARWNDARVMLRHALRNEPENPELVRLSKRLLHYRIRYYVRKLRILLRLSPGHQVD